jgi:hypothetical protein
MESLTQTTQDIRPQDELPGLLKIIAGKPKDNMLSTRLQDIQLDQQGMNNILPLQPQKGLQKTGGVQGEQT